MFSVRGNKFESLEEITEETRYLTPCAKCGNAPVNGHDYCIANLPGVIYACCGHGGLDDGYIYFENGVIIRGDFKIERHTDIMAYNNSDKLKLQGGY